MFLSLKHRFCWLPTICCAYCGFNSDMSNVSLVQLENWSFVVMWCFKQRWEIQIQGITTTSMYGLFACNTHICHINMKHQLHHVGRYTSPVPWESVMGPWSLTDSLTGATWLRPSFQGRRSLCLAFPDCLPSSLACSLATPGRGGSDGRDGFMGETHGGERWWQLKCFFHAHPDLLGDMIQFDSYFSEGLVGSTTNYIYI